MRKYLDIPLTLIVGLALTVAMLWPLDAPPPAPEGSDKLVHLIAFAALAFPLARTGRLGLLSVFIGASAFGGAIELIQPMFNRSADVNDWIADTVGVIIGIGCGLLYRRLRKRGAFFVRSISTGLVSEFVSGILMFECVKLTPSP